MKYLRPTFLEFALGRQQMVTGTMSYDNSNVFAKILRGELPCHKVYETDAVLAFMDVMPRGEGHVLVIPKAQARTIIDIHPDDLSAVMQAAKFISMAAMDAFSANGITIIQSNESAGGQVMFHFHVHVVPRHDGVDLRPHSETMENPEILAANAEKLRLALETVLK